MKPSTELFDLIKSLTKSEKRFFKLSSSLQDGEKNYLKIFDAIDRQRKYNETALKTQFKSETFIRHFASEKNHLYRLILKSLRNYQADLSPAALLRQEIKNIEILFKKGLYKECHKFLQRAKKMAEAHESFYDWSDLISIEKQLLEEDYESGEFNKDLNALIQEEADVIEKLRNLAEYHIIYSRINYVFRKEGFAHNREERQAVSEIENHHLIKGKNTALSKRASTICYYIKGLCAHTNREYDEAVNHFRRVQEIFDQHPHIRSELAKRYLKTLTSLLYCYIDSGRYADALGLIPQFTLLTREEGFNTPAIELKIFSSTHIARLMLLNKSGDFESAVALSETLFAELERYGDRINKEQRLLFTYTIAYAFFGAGKHKESLQWINTVLNDSEQTLRHDIYNFAHLLNLLIHYELGNHELLEYSIKSTARFLNKKEKDYQAESIVLSYLKKLIKPQNALDRKEIYEKMQIELEALFGNPVESVVLEYVDVLAWLDAHLSGESFAECVKRRQAQTARPKAGVV